jgi:hypothetical protein
MLPNAIPLILCFLYYYLLILIKVPLTSAMANKAQPEYVKSQILHLLKEQLVQEAVEMYRTQTGKTGTCEWLGYRKVAAKVMDKHEERTRKKPNEKGEWVEINWTTVRKCDEGTRSLLETRADDALLTPEEDILLTEFLAETADRGFPANNRRVKEAALSILRKRDADASFTVSDSWVTRFLNRKKARNQLAKYWSKSLKNIRGGGVNPTTHREYFKLLTELFEKHDFAEECIWGGDESAFQKGACYMVIYGVYALTCTLQALRRRSMWLGGMERKYNTRYEE